MKFSSFVYLWLVLTVLMIFEHYALNYHINLSTLNFLKHNVPAFANLNLATDTGKTISYFLGWAGFGTILLSNIYLLRKRLFFLSKMGNLQNWLNFHIFCGMFGPTLIIFHTDFKVGGLVAISFWSMMTVAISGVIGRYFYIQVLKKKSSLNGTVGKVEKHLKKMIKEAGIEDEEAAFSRLQKNVYRFIGKKDDGSLSEKVYGFGDLVIIFVVSLLGDIKGMFIHPKSIAGMPGNTRVVLGFYATTLRELQYYTPFQTLLGYWHSFHIPFAVVMYIVAVIHVIVALLFQV